MYETAQDLARDIKSRRHVSIEGKEAKDPNSDMSESGHHDEKILPKLRVQTMRQVTIHSAKMRYSIYFIKYGVVYMYAIKVFFIGAPVARNSFQGYQNHPQNQEK